MITETENAPSWAPVVVVGLVAAALGSALLFDPPLESQRPSNPSAVLEAPQHRQFPLARLWQDPLHAVYAHWNAADEPRKSIPFVTDAAIGAAGPGGGADGGGRDVLRLFVMMPGTPYSNDRETRRRQRHAVVSALTSRDFVPGDETRLRYFHAPPFRQPSDVAAAGSSSDQMLVAYETYEPATGTELSRRVSVAVFWLNAEDFLLYPLHKVSALVAALDWRRCPDSGIPTTVLLGPPSSSVLRAMLEEPEAAPAVVTGFLRQIAQVAQKGPDFETLASSARVARGGLRVFSSRATIPVGRLCRPANARCRAAGSGDAATADADVAGGDVTRGLRVASFHSVIADDGRVLEAILRELVVRGACKVKEDSPRVVIVSEQDTLYGRLLGGVAEHAAKRVHEQEGCKIRITKHGYLQGVDGESPGVEGPARRNEPASGDAAPAVPARAVPSLPGGGFEQPFGAAQLDYVRRLSERLENESNASLVAIGVLGNDLYDKLLILQALRERHPGVVFFTTDMDARLLAPAVYPWTRNLIVGSAYGLSLQKLPAVTFRDSYQAALFAAVRQALNLPEVLGPPEPSSTGSRPSPGTTEVPGPPEPKLFEISRTGVVPLDAPGSRDRDWKKTAALLTPLAALAVFALVMRRRQREAAAHVRRRRYGFVAVLAAAAAGCLFLFVQYRLRWQEPGPLFDGVSTVPMVTLQLTTIVFAVAVVAFANGRMRHALSHVAGRLGGTEPDHGLPALRAAVRDWRAGYGTAVRAVLSWRWISGSLVSTWKYDVAGADKGSEKEAADLWSDVWHYSRWGPRFCRIGAGLLVGLALREMYFVSVRLEQPLLGQAVTVPGWLVWVLPIMLFWAISYCRDTLGTWQAFIRAVGRFDVPDGKMESEMESTMESRMKSEAAIRGHWSMDLLVRCTDLVGPVVVLPLILMVLLLLARSTLFEGWNWTPPLVAFHVGLAVYVLFVAIAFQREASHARAAVLDRLREARLVAEAGEATEIENVMEYIRSRRDGAFVPWTQHPILQTLVLPLGSVALITLLEVWLGR